ncbi:MAG TPA: hypothetical protein VF458_00555 [Ktedonobacteraceae bacterium]
MTQTLPAPRVRRRYAFQAIIAQPLFQVFALLCLLAGAFVCAGIAAFGPGRQSLAIFLLGGLFAGLSVLLVPLVLRQERRRYGAVLSEFTSNCQRALDGESTRHIQLLRLQIPRGARLAVQTFDQLLDSYGQMRANSQTRGQELTRLSAQIEQLRAELQPVMEGDLRARSSVSGGTLGIIGAVCNALVEDTAQLIQWTQYMSDQIIQTSHGLVDHALEIAQLTEAFAAQQEKTTSTIEALMVFTLQMESALFANIEMLREHWAFLQEARWVTEVQFPQSAADSQGNSLTESFQEVAQQMKLLDAVLLKTHETTVLADKSLKELQHIAQRFQRINGVVVQLASMTSTLTSQAENWREAAENYTLPTPTGTQKRIVDTASLLISS